MEVILLEDVKSLGKKGDIVKVSVSASQEVMVRQLPPLSYTILCRRQVRM